MPRTVTESQQDVRLDNIMVAAQLLLTWMIEEAVTLAPDMEPGDIDALRGVVVQAEADRDQ